MAEALYRKYRPSTFRDIVGQEHIERTLKNAIEQNKVSHAYLFCGPRGTGKTTTARILAKALLCEKGPTIDPDGTCPECEAIANGNHPDVYELDAASRTGVENVREEIISRVHYAPTRGSVKVYIIDEVHMLSQAAFNALLKTLEEPPEHVIFILCTTDPQKVPETIHSRCQRFDFHRISVDTIVARLGAVCMHEGVEFEPEALELIAYRADGGMRNALTSLEQLIAFGEGSVTLSGAQNLLGSLDDSGLAEIVSAIGMRDVAVCFTWTARYVETGADLAQFVLDLTEHVRNLYLLSVTKGEVELSIPDSSRENMKGELKYFSQDRLSRLLGILDETIKELRVSSNPRLSFEIALTRMVRPESDLTLESLAERIESLEKRLSGKLDPQAYIGVPVVRASAPAGSVPIPPASVSASSSQTDASVMPARFATEGSSVHAASSVSSASVQPSFAQTGTASVSQTSSNASSPKKQPVAEQVATQRIPSSAQNTQSVQQKVAISPQASSSASSPSVSVSQSSAATSQTVSSEQPRVSQSAGKSTIDLSNPANLQRMWHSITSHLRKVNPARGVLFMNARVSAADQNTTILVEFSADSGFAYTAAQKPEVQELLKQSIQSVVGVPVPFRLELAGGNASAPTVPTFANATKASAAPARSVAPESTNLSQGRQQLASYSVQPAAQGVSQSFTSQRSQVSISQQSQTASAWQSQAPTSSQSQVSASLQSRDSVSTGQISSQGTASALHQAPVVSAPSSFPEDESVPLDVYESYASAEYDSGKQAFSMPADASRPTRSASAASSSQPTQDFSSEAEEIKSILTASFGEGIKFEEVNE